MTKIEGVEVLWTCIAAIGVFISIFNMLDAIGDYRASRYLTNGRRYIAVTGLFNELSRVTVQGIFVVLGLWSLTLQNSEHHFDGMGRGTFTIVAHWAFVFCALLIAVQSHLAWLLRKELKRWANSHDL